MRAFKERKTKANGYILGSIPEAQWRSKINAAQIVNCQQKIWKVWELKEEMQGSLAFTVDAIVLDCGKI